MGWYTTAELDRFVAAAGAYLRSTAVENTLLLSAAQDARSAAGTGLLFGWWEPPDGSDPRGAFFHDPSVPLLIAGRAPEMAAALAGTLAKLGRPVCGVDGSVEAADAFAAAWSHRAGATIQLHRQRRVYRLTAAPGAWPPPDSSGPNGLLRVATAADRGLLVDWLTAAATEAGDRIGSVREMADDLIGYGGAVFWATGYQPVAMATLTRPVAGTVRIAMVYTPPERRRNGYADAVTLAASRAVLAGIAPASAPGAGSEVVLITDRPERRAGRLGYQLVDERAVLRFGPPTGPLPNVRTTGPMPRLPTGPLPRLRR